MWLRLLLVWLACAWEGCSFVSDTSKVICFITLQYHKLNFGSQPLLSRKRDLSSHVYYFIFRGDRRTFPFDIHAVRSASFILFYLNGLPNIIILQRVLLSLFTLGSGWRWLSALFQATYTSLFSLDFMFRLCVDTGRIQVDSLQNSEGRICRLVGNHLSLGTCTSLWNTLYTSKLSSNT